MITTQETYKQFLGEIKERIRFAQQKAALHVNRELISIIRINLHFGRVKAPAIDRS